MNALTAGLCFLCCSAVLLKAAEQPPVFSLPFSRLPSFLQWHIRKQVAGKDDLIESWTGWNPVSKNSAGPSGGLVFMQEVDLVGDSGKEKVFLYRSPEIAGTPPPQEEHARFICNADNSYLYTVPSFCLRGKKIDSVFRGENAYYFCPDRYVNGHRFIYGWKQWELTGQYGRVMEWSGCEETSSKDGIYWKSGMEQKESIYVNTGVIEKTCSLSPGSRQVLLSRKAGDADPFETVVKEKAKSHASPEQEKWEEDQPSEMVWAVSLFELLTQDVPQWKCFKAVSLREAEKEWRKVSPAVIEQSRQWNQKEAVQAMNALLNVNNLQGIRTCPLFQFPTGSTLKDDKTPSDSSVDGKTREIIRKTAEISR